MFRLFRRKQEGHILQESTASNLINPPSMWGLIKIQTILGILFVLACSTRVIYWQGAFLWNLSAYLTSAGTLLLVAGGCYFAGGLTGFLFGIPKIVQPSPTSADSEKAKTIITQNDNLVQISDWITKIIVGVGLTQLYNIPHFLNKVGIAMAPSFSLNENILGRNVAIVTILYFSILGFMSVYLWTRLYFTKEVRKLEDDLGKIMDDINTIKKANNALQELSVDVGGGKNTPKAELHTIRRNSAESAVSAKEEYEDDPQKGKWGGKSEVNGRMISAKVNPGPFPGFYMVEIRVVSTDISKPLTGFVKFFLHDTFINSNPIIAVEENVAVLNLTKVYGAFTIGAEADGGDTKLELDLAELPDAPAEFKSR